MRALLNWIYSIPPEVKAEWGQYQEPTWSDAWQAGGWAMYPLMMVAMFGLMAAALLIFFTVFSRGRPASKVPAILVLTFGLLAIAVGVIGRQSGRNATDEALANVTPEDRALIRGAGYGEADVPLKSAILIGTPLLLIAVALRPRRSNADPIEASPTA